MFDKNDLYSILHNPVEYEKRKEYDRKKKIFYGNELRIQIEENNKIKNQINGNMEKFDLPIVPYNNSNYFMKNNEISKDNNDYNNYNLYNEFNHKMMNYHYTENGINKRNQFMHNLPNIYNQKDINYNKSNKEYYFNKNDLNIEKLFNDFIEFQINVISNYINTIDKLNNSSPNLNTNNNNSFESKKRKNTDSPNKSFKEKNTFNNITFYDNTIDIKSSPKKNDIYLLRLSIEKEKKKAINFIKKEKQKLINELGYFPEQGFNNKIEDLFNKIANKKIIKYSSIPIPNNTTLNSLDSNQKAIEQNETKTNNINRSSSSSDISPKYESKLKFTKSNNYSSDNNTYNNKDIKMHSNNTLKNMKNENIEDNEKNNNKQKDKESSKNNYKFAFKNNSFNSYNNAEMSNSLSKKVKNDDDKSNSHEKNKDNITLDNNEEEKEEESSSISGKEKDDKYIQSNIINKNPKKKDTIILSKKNNIMDIFSKNEKKRMKKFSINFKYKKINDLFYDEHKKKKNEKFIIKNPKQIYSFPVNQNFKNIKNISNDIKLKNSKAKHIANSQKIFPFFRKRSRSYKDKKINNKLTKKIEEYNNNVTENSDNNSKEIFNKENSKIFSYDYQDDSNNKEKNSKINKRKNTRYNTGHFYYKNRKKKLSVPGKSIDRLSVGFINTEVNKYLVKKNKTKTIEKKQNFFKKKSSSYGINNEKNKFEEKMKENLTNKFFNKRSGSSFIRNINSESNPVLSNNNLNINNEIYGEDDKLYKMIQNFEKNVKERIKFDKNKKISNNKINNIQLNNLQLNKMQFNNNMNINMNVNNNILVKNSLNNFNEVELIPKKYIYRCKKVIYPEIESEKLIEKERLLFGRNKYN